ncbi:hypothetical protein J2W40_002194 [Sphingobium xenophagum]|uniref:Uncharacterized protein n=1 Tax=Sphingobium xenophagum TaxID=121428 RepID=A0ABU1X1B1_SPHXE|nr:hypothetical protein [Sphingobium xenophagum]MDR7155367.1 hypothetical protein [Sphingobium xenophagum]
MSSDSPEKITQVEPQDASQENSPKASKGQGEEGSFMEDAGHASCKWNGNEYSDGGVVCDSRLKYKCWNGKWVEIGNC